MAAANVFVVGAGDIHMKELQTVRGAGTEVDFHKLLEMDEVVHVASLDIGAVLEKAHRQLDEFDGSVDAIIAQWDFPTTLIVPALCKERGLASPSLKAVLHCGHKYWSRVAQAEAIPELTPRFQLVDPFAADADRVDMPFPFWLKPVKGFASVLGFRIDSHEQLREALSTIREKIGRLAAPFDELMERIGVPDRYRRIGGRYCIAEEYLSGRELAHEGHVFQGDVRIHGTLDMVREREVFTRFMWPSRAPKDVLDRMADATRRLITHIGFDSGCFNAEFFWEPDSGRLSIIEVNPRLSQSHSHMCILVDGHTNHEIAVDIALGRRPRYQPGAGDYALAAKFLDRTPRDGVVRRVPSDEEIRRIEEHFPTALIDPQVHAGERLSDLVDQDGYSYLVAEIHLGGQSEEELLESHRRLLEELPLEIDGVELPNDLIGQEPAR